MGATVASGTAEQGASPGGKPQPILSVRDLRVSFGGVKAIDGIDFEVFDGEILGVIGPNGSGKTTTFNVITGLVEATGGSVTWKSDHQLVGARPWTIYRLGVARTFQNIRLPPGLSVIENIMSGLYPQQRGSWLLTLLNLRAQRDRDQALRREAERTLRLVSPNLSLAPDRLVAELSYADRRRVEIARAVVAKPKLLFLDEPTAGMNARETQELSEDIRKVRDAGITIVLIEHKMKFISDLANRVIVLNFGKKIAEGSYEEIRRDEQVIEAYLGRRRAAQA
jgi:ABC-type branched-subunit amino acid transport system ATPase component